MNQRARWELPTLTLIVVLAAVWRLPWLGAQSFWSDEIGTLLTAAKPLAKLLGTIFLFDVNPPLFYVLLHGWLRLGHDEWIARLWPALCGIAAVPLLWRFARRYVGPQAAAAATLLLAVWPAHVYYSGELRYQTTTTLLAVLSFSCFADLLAGGHRRAGYLAATIVGLYTNYVFLFLVAAQAVMALASTERRRLLRAVLVAGMSFIPGLLVLAWQIVQRNWGVKTLVVAPPVERWFDLLSLWTFGGVPWRGTTLFPALDQLHDVSLWRYQLAFAALALPVVALLIRGARLAWRSPAGRLTIIWAFVPTAAMLALSLFAPVFEVKLLLPTLPAVAVLLGLGVAGPVEQPARRYAIVWNALGVYFLVLATLAVHQQLADPRYARDDWRGLAHRLSADLAPGDVVLNATFELRYYSPRPLPEERLVAGDLGEFVKRGRTQSRAQTEAHLADIVSRYRRVWFHPNAVRGIQLVEDAERYLLANLYDATPEAYRTHRPTLRLLLKDRGGLARQLAPRLPAAIDFAGGLVEETALRGTWLPTDEGWRWTTAGSSAWLRRDTGAMQARARVYVNTDLYPQGTLRVMLQAEGVTVAELTVSKSNQYMLTGPLPEAALALPAVELQVVTDKIIYQDANDRIAPTQARTLLVGELALVP